MRVDMGPFKYCCPKDIRYTSPRYMKSVFVPKGYLSDGASGPASDIVSDSWWIHDMLCDIGKWEDETKCSNWQASRVLSDILKEEGHGIRSKTWLVATFLFGGGAARKNGMFKVKSNDNDGSITGNRITTRKGHRSNGRKRGHV